jgi:protein-tyrosine sulfotransferase
MQLVLVGGSQRSGTTMLQLLLCANARTNTPLTEAVYLRNLVEVYRRAKSDFYTTSYYFDDVDEFRQFHARLVDLFLERTAARFPGIDTLVLKDPDLTRLFPDLFELVPTSKFVIIFRDPRDVIASMITVGEKLAEQNVESMFQRRDMRQLVNHYLSFYTPVVNNRNNSFRERAMVVRYEDLVGERNEEVIEGLKEFTGLKFDFGATEDLDDAVRQKLDELRSTDRFKPWLTALTGRGVSSDSVGRHEEILSEDEIRRVEKYCGPFMQAFNYHSS